MLYIKLEEELGLLDLQKKMNFLLRKIRDVLAHKTLWIRYFKS